MTARDAILARIEDRPDASLQAPYRIELAQPKSLVKLFASRLEALGGKMAEWSDLSAFPGRSWCVDAGVGPLPSECGSFEPGTAWSADLGITRAVVGIAETGTVLIVHGPSDHRLASLAPPHHVAVLKESDIVLTLDEAFDRLPTRNSVLITGPSRTADIEGVLVRGVHGPRDVWVILEKS